MPPAIDRSLRLPPDQFLPATGIKNGIAIHHTVGGSARSTFNWWLQDDAQVGTAYIIARDGTIHEVFPADAWAWQFGLKWSRARRIAYEQRFVGIELASEGGLIEVDGKLYCFDRVSARCEKSRDEAFDHGEPYRSYRFFDNYEAAQIDSLVQLVDHLCTEFGIPRQRPTKPIAYHGDLLESFSGVIGHAMVRKDKSDPAPVPGFWERLQTDCGIVEIGGAGATTGATAGDAPAGATGGAAGAAGGRLDEAGLEKLFVANMTELNKMHVPAGSMVKGLIMELERGGRSTYIRLHDAVAGGHGVQYDFVQGRRDLVGRVGRALRFARVTDALLEVRGG